MSGLRGFEKGAHALGGRFGLAVLAIGLCSLLAQGCKKTRSLESLVYFDLLAHRFEAVREFQSHLPGDSTWYEESLTSLGDGSSFELMLQKVQGKDRSSLTGAALKEFDLFQRRLDQGEGYRVLFQRDFRVEDLGRTLQNYRVLVDRSSNPGRLAPPNESYLSFWVLPYATDRSSFHVTVSTEAGREGFPLSYREFIDVAGIPTLAYEMRILSLSYGTSRSFLSRQSPVLSRQTISLATAASAPHPMYIPTNLPSGFDLERVEEVVQSTDAGSGPQPAPVTMQRMIFTDGVARVDLVQHAPFRGSSTSGASFGGANPLVVLLRSMGPLEIAHGTTDSSEFVIESRITGASFRDVLQSLSRIN